MPTSSKIMHSNPHESCLKIRRYVKKNTIFVLRIIELRDIMAKYRLCCIGFITRDKVVTPQETVCMPGGTAYYFARAISHLQPEGFQLVTAVGEDDLSVVEDIRKLGIDVVCRTAPQSVCFENIYHSVNQSDRTQRVTAVAAPFGLEELKVADAEVIHLGSLLQSDFSVEVIKHLATRGKVTADVQGFLREVQQEAVMPVDWTEKREALRYIHTLKANRDEMLTITGCEEPHEAALILADWGVKEVVLTFDEEGSLIYTRGEFTEVPAYPTAKLIDATGCGDTYMVGYLYQRSLGASPYEAGCFAAAMCTIKLQGFGPFNANEQAVRQIMSSSSSLEKLGIKI